MLTRFLATLALAFALAAGAVAQDAPLPQDAPDLEVPESEVAGDARAQYGAAIEEAEAGAAQGTPEGHIAAGDAYLRAAQIAQDSGDEELTPSAPNAREAAISSYVSAATAYAGQQQSAEAAEQFARAAEVAEEQGDTELQARLTYNAGTSYVQAEQHDEAVAAFDRAIALNPDDLNYQFVRAVALRGAGDAEGALTAFEELAVRAEEAGDERIHAQAGNAAGTVYLVQAQGAIQGQNFREAITHLDQAARFLPEDNANLNTLYANAYYRLGVSQVQAEQFGTARQSLQRAQQYARTAGRDQIVQGAQAQLDYIQQVQG